MTCPHSRLNCWCGGVMSDNDTITGPCCRCKQIAECAPMNSIASIGGEIIDPAIICVDCQELLLKNSRAFWDAWK